MSSCITKNGSTRTGIFIRTDGNRNEDSTYQECCKKDTTKTKETKVIPATPVNTENIAPPSFNLPNPTFDDTANLAPQIETNAGGTNEEDDMLAMLEGLLG